MTSTNTIKTSTNSVLKLIVLFVILLSSSSSMFSQNADANANVVISSENVNGSTSVNATANNNMNLYSWFMGTKQTPNANLEKDNSGSIKKQMINSGTEPNRLLLKSFLKKASNYTEVVV